MTGQICNFSLNSKGLVGLSLFLFNTKVLTFKSALLIRILKKDKIK